MKKWTPLEWVLFLVALIAFAAIVLGVYDERFSSLVWIALMVQSLALLLKEWIRWKRKKR